MGCHLIKKNLASYVILDEYSQYVRISCDLLYTHTHTHTHTHTIPAIATVKGLSLSDFATSLAPKFYCWPLEKKKSVIPWSITC